MESETKPAFSLFTLGVAIGVLALFFVVLVPACNDAVARAVNDATGARGKDIYVAIVGANTEREQVGLPNVWPKTMLAEDNLKHPQSHPKDIAWFAFQNSTDYFYELFDGANIGTTNHSPYIAFEAADYSKLAYPDRGVPVKKGTGKLRPENNMWCIAGNIRNEMADIIPVLVTRNVDCSSLLQDFGAPVKAPARYPPLAYLTPDTLAYPQKK
ncbi:MAG: hypothetical protein FWG50_08420 [Kiritimatiellaeota bacterium]|nr:hypothetical protein [Kiritimatiellota bacterium]